MASATPAGAATAVIRTGTSFGGASTSSSSRNVAGTASSIAFTPMQGIEIVNPHAAEKRGDDSSAKYFSSNASFFNIKK
jgi:U4/U6 small nuclear ribonucleoprotein PRP31